MHLFELFDGRVDLDDNREEEDQRFAPGEDQSRLKITDTRKTRLTLRHINKLRTMNELRAVEMQEKLKKIKTQYGARGEQAQL